MLLIVSIVAGDKSRSLNYFREALFREFFENFQNSSFSEHSLKNLGTDFLKCVDLGDCPITTTK